MKITEDKYQGITIDTDTLPKSIDDFQKEISSLIPNLNGSKLLWVKIPIEKADFIPVISIYDDSEIIEARWIDVDEYLTLKDTNNYNKNVVLAALNNKELKLTEQQIQLSVSGAEVFF